MDWFNSDWLASWAGLDGADAMPLVSTLVAVVALMVLWRVLRRGDAGGRAARDYDVSGDQFAQSAPINEEQVRLLHYLQQAFPDGAVLFQPRLARFLMVRKSRHRLDVQQRLGDTHVDFLVCADDGKPLFAFEVDAFKAKGDAGLARSAAEKNGMLKSAGIRLIRLKGAQPQWPPPEVLRMRDDIARFVATWLPCYVRDHRNYLTVAIGCTGGQHRSVYFCEWLGREFGDRAHVLVRHRELALTPSR